MQESFANGGTCVDCRNATALQREIAAAYDRLGAVLGKPYAANLGNVKGALESYRKALRIREELVSADPRNPQDRRELVELAVAFGAPVTSISDGSGGGGRTTFSAAGQCLGVPVLTAELGGRASLSPEGLAIAERGLRNVLHRRGILQEAAAEPIDATRFMRVLGRGAFVYAWRRGLFEPAAELGESVRAGQHAGVIHIIDRPWKTPEPVEFAENGMVACRRAPVLTVPGDCLYKLLVDVDPG